MRTDRHERFRPGQGSATVGDADTALVAASTNKQTSRLQEGALPRRLVTIAAFLVVSIAAGCSMTDTAAKHPAKTDQPTSPSGVPSATREHAATAGAVVIKDAAFVPRTLEVKIGQTVTWTNDDTAAHTVTADDGTFDLSLKAAAAGKRRFDAAGRVAYHCRIHPSNLWMSGVVVVS